MKTLVITLMALALYMAPCSAHSFTVVSNEPPMLVFLCNEGIHVHGNWYEFLNVTHNMDTGVNVAMHIVANKQTHRYIIAGWAMGFPDGSKSIHTEYTMEYTYKDGGGIDRSIKIIDRRLIQ